MKALYNSMVDYFADNVLHAALVASVSIILIFVLLIVLSFSIAYGKKVKAAKTKAPAPKANAKQQTAKPAATPAPAAKPAVAEEPAPAPQPKVEEKPIEQPKVEEKPIEEEKTAEQPAVEEEIAPVAVVEEVEEAPAPIEEVAEEPAPIEEVAEEPAPIEEVAEEPAPIEEVAEEPAPIEEVAEEPAPIEEVAEEPAPIEEVAEEPAPIEEVAEEPAPIEEVAEEPAPIEEVAEEPAPIEKVAEEPAPIEEVAEEPAPIEEVAEEPAPVKEKVVVATEAAATLHDELKDVDTEIDFYEEDGADQEARYKGKWVICRIVTDDKSNEEMYFFELHASNGEKLLTSEEYTTYNGAMRGIQTHKNNILKGNFRITVSKRGDYIFKLLSGKNMLLCMGEGYATKARCEAAIESAKRFAKTAIIDENIQYQVVKVPVEDDDTPIEAPKGNSKGKWLIDSNVTPDGETVYFFELFANNGERLLSSEEYSTYVGAVNGIQTHRNNISKGNFRITLTKRGDYIYKLLNSNGQLLCLGEHYKTKRLCQSAVDSVKRFALNSPILVNSNIKK